MNQNFSFIKELEEKNKKRKVHFFKWDQKYSVKNKIIDEQHRKLFLLVDELYFFPFEKQKKGHLKKILIELISYCKYHFATEERLFEIKKYKFLEQHKKEHKHFIQRINNFYNDFIEGKEIHISEFIKFMKEWLKNHVMVNDMKYVDVLKD